MRNYERETVNTYKGLKADFSYEVDDHWTIKFGGTGRRFKFTTNQFERNNDTLNPTEREAGVSIASLGQVIDFGQGLEVPEGTTTSFFAPSLEAFDNVFGFTCNCINKYGDFRITRKRNRSASFGGDRGEPGLLRPVQLQLRRPGRPTAVGQPRDPPGPHGRGFPGRDDRRPADLRQEQL
jgi:hypothetical protein